MTPTLQMDVLYLTATGHVLAIFTRASEPANPEADGSAFLGEGFHIRGFGNAKQLASFQNQEFIIPANQISLARVTNNPSQAISPWQQQLTQPPSGGPLVTGLGKAPTSFKYETGMFTITPAPACSYTIEVYGPIPGSVPLLPNTTLSNQSNITLISNSSYFAIAFVSGCQIAVHAFTA